ncbi:MAG: helix-turn-helix transcriptional regulator [Bacteroidia bacterium]|nr:helix-turn-helix transcriptional regulator [Bacteroidia bacterium]
MKTNNKNKNIQTCTLDELTDKYIGKKGTAEREKFEYELRVDIIGEMIKQARHEKNMTQEQLGELIGVQKAQISKIENNTKDVRFSTILRVFEALKARVNLSIKFENHKLYKMA